MKKKALIFGVTGQDGSYLAEFLLKKNYKVYGLDRKKTVSNSKRLFDKIASNKNIKISMGIPPIDGFAKKEQGIEIKKDVVDPTWEVKQKFSENQKNVSKYSRDYYLGDIKTSSKFIRIVCRDHEYEDGDRIKLLLNNSIIHPNISLRNSGYTIDIKLKDGLNTIEFFALNEGSASPNTAELKVFDENSAIIGSGQWLLTTGYKARLIVLHQ